MKNDETTETTQLKEITDEKLEAFTIDYYRQRDELRSLEINNKTLDKYADLDLNVARMISSENLLESSFALKRIHPDLSEILFKIGNSLINDTRKDLLIQEEMDTILDADEDLRALFDELVSVEPTKTSNED